MQIEIYSKDACGQCIQAKTLLKQKCFDYVEHILGKDVSVQDLMQRASDANSTKPLRSAPQIFVDGEHVGEYKDFVNFLAEHESACAA